MKGRLLSVGLLFMLVSSPASEARGDTAKDVSFRRDVWPILRRHCRGCHHAGDAKGGLSLDSVAAMRTGGESGPLFDFDKPDESLLLEAVTGDEPEMPKQQPPLSPAKIDILRAWVAAGAKDDSPNEAARSKVVIPAAYRHPPAVTSVDWSVDGTRFAAACRSEVVVVSAENNKPQHRLKTECDLITQVDFSPNGQLLAVSGGSPGQFGEVRFFSTETWREIGVRRHGRDTLFRGQFDPQSASIALGGTDGAVHIIPVETSAPVRSFPIHSDWVVDAAWTVDGAHIVTVGRDKATKVCSVETGRLLRSIDMSADRMSSVECDAGWVYSSGRAKTLFGYELKVALTSIEVTGAGNNSRPVTKRDQYAKAMESQPGEVLAMAVSGDRKRLAVAGRFPEVRIYRTSDRSREVRITGVPTPVFSLALNNDGSRLVLGTAFGETRVYGLPDGKLVKSLIPVPIDRDGAAEKDAAE